jgi:hypothetical protein
MRRMLFFSASAAIRTKTTSNHGEPWTLNEKPLDQSARTKRAAAHATLVTYAVTRTSRVNQVREGLPTAS